MYLLTRGDKIWVQTTEQVDTRWMEAVRTWEPNTVYNTGVSARANKVREDEWQTADDEEEEIIYIVPNHNHQS